MLSTISHAPIGGSCAASAFLILLLIVLMIITHVPALTMWLPHVVCQLSARDVSRAAFSPRSRCGG